MFNFLFSIGQFDKAKGGIYIESSQDPSVAKKIREEVDCPSGVTFFTFVDFPLKENFSDEEVGELLGVLSTILDTLPYNQIPVPIYHSHNVDVADIENNQKALRVKFFSSLNPEEMFGQLLKGQGIKDAPKLTDVLKGGFKIELPFSLTDASNASFRFTNDQMKIKMQGVVDVDHRLEEKAKQIINTLPPNMKYAMQMRLAIASFFKGVDFTFTFSDMDTFFKDVAFPTSLSQRRALGPANNQPSLSEIKALVNDFSKTDVSSAIPILFAQAPALAQQFGQGQPYEQVRKNLLGLSTIHIQIGDSILKFRFVGLDVFPLLPAIAE